MAATEISRKDPLPELEFKMAATEMSRKDLLPRLERESQTEQHLDDKTAQLLTLD